jgi:cytochrome c oxidase subunit 2
MNTVPGIPTRFKMKPTITTAEMRQKLGNDEFNYILLCNKVCGVSHYNMKINVIVEDEKDYLAWVEKQKKFKQDETQEESSSSTTDSTAVTGIPAVVVKNIAQKK